MSTSDLTYKIDTKRWDALTIEAITNLFLYGELSAPIDLNERVKPLAAAGDSLGLNIGAQGSLTLYQIIQKIDEESFVQDGREKLGQTH